MAPPKRPVRNKAARSWSADVRRFLRLINTDEVLGTHSSHRSLSLFLRKLFCLRASNVLTTAYEFETNGAASHKGDIKRPCTTLDRCHEFEWRLPSLVSPNYEVHAARPAITAHAAALSKGVSTGPKLVSQF